MRMICEIFEVVKNGMLVTTKNNWITNLANWQYPIFVKNFIMLWYQCTTWVIRSQLIHFFPGPSPILMKFGRLVDPPERLTHTKSPLIIIIIDEAVYIIYSKK